MNLMRSLWIGIVVLGLLAGGCTTAKDAAADGVELRIANRSDRDFEKVDVTFTSPDTLSYGPVARGASSDYQRVTGDAYRYGLVVVTAGGETFRFQPIDFVGETPLAPGRYTFALSIDPNDRMVTIDLVED